MELPLEMELLEQVSKEQRELQIGLAMLLKLKLEQQLELKLEQ